MTKTYCVDPDGTSVWAWTVRTVRVGGRVFGYGCGLDGSLRIWLTSEGDPVMLRDDPGALLDIARTLAGCEHQYADECDCDLDKALDILASIPKIVLEYHGPTNDDDELLDQLEWLAGDVELLRRWTNGKRGDCSDSC